MPNKKSDLIYHAELNIKNCFAQGDTPNLRGLLVLIVNGPLYPKTEEAGDYHNHDIAQKYNLEPGWYKSSSEISIRDIISAWKKDTDYGEGYLNDAASTIAPTIREILEQHQIRDDRWSTQGEGLFGFSKVPDGIKKLRNYLDKLSNGTSAEKLIAISDIAELLAEKTKGNKPEKRSQEVHDLYNNLWNDIKRVGITSRAEHRATP